MSAQRQQEWDRQSTELARRQALFREVNEQVARIGETFGSSEAISILCECGSSHCQERFELSRETYERLRLIPTHFAVVPGHDIPAVERVVEEHEAFAIVEKLGESALVAIKLDPRRRRQSRPPEGSIALHARRPNV